MKPKSVIAWCHEKSMGIWFSTRAMQSTATNVEYKIGRASQVQQIAMPPYTFSFYKSECQYKVLKLNTQKALYFTYSASQSISITSREFISYGNLCCGSSVTQIKIPRYFSPEYFSAVTNSKSNHNYEIFVLCARRTP